MFEGPLLEWLTSSHLHLGIYIVGHLLAFFVIGYALFGSWVKFFTSFFFMLKSDWISALDGSLDEDRGSEFTFFLFLFMCVALTVSMYYVINKKMAGG